MSGFPPEIIALAQSAQKVTGCLASVTLAQWAQESGFGAAMPHGSNNPFGIKAVAGQPYVLARTKEERNGHLITTSAKFRKFNSILDAFIAHGRLLMNPHGPYKKALIYRDNPIKFIDVIAPIYATDSRYGVALKHLIVKYRLDQYDLKRA